MSNYPGGFDNFTLPVAGQPLNAPSQVAIVTALQEALVAVQQALGLNPQGAEVDVVTRFDSGLGLRQRLFVPTSTTFVKADYSWLRFLIAKCQAGGGGGGGAAATGAGESSGGAGGNGGTYAEKLILVEDLSASETLTVGSGGTANAGGTGGTGGTTSFGTHCIANGGQGGAVRTNTGAGNTLFQSPSTPGTGGSVGDLISAGSAGVGAIVTNAGVSRALGGSGGKSFLGGGGRGLEGNSNPGGEGLNYGGGGGGAGNGASQFAQPGGVGAPGLIIVEMYA